MIRRFELAIRELGRRFPVLSDEEHVHGQPAAPFLHEQLLARCEDLGLGLPDLVGLKERPEALGVDPDAVAHRLDLGRALRSAGMVEANVPADELGRAAGQLLVVAHGHHVVEPVDTDAIEAGRVDAIAQPVARPVDEDLFLDPARLVLADVARLRWEDDRRVAVLREQHVGVAVHDHEARHVRHGSLETGVFVAGHDHSVEIALDESAPDARIATLDLGPIGHA